MTDPDKKPRKTTAVDRVFAPLLEAALRAYAATLKTGKPPRTPRALVYFAWLAFLEALGLAHMITPEARKLAAEAASPPGRKPLGQQTEVWDVMTHFVDHRPGFYLSEARLRVGAGVNRCGTASLDLSGCYALSTATARAVEAGWGVLPETRGAAQGLRFLPPSVVALYLAGEPASLAGKPTACETPSSIAPNNAAPTLDTACFAGESEPPASPLPASGQSAFCAAASKTLDRAAEAAGEPRSRKPRKTNGASGKTKKRARS